MLEALHVLFGTMVHQERAANGKEEYSICLVQLFHVGSFQLSSNFIVLQIKAKE